MSDKSVAQSVNMTASPPGTYDRDSLAERLNIKPASVSRMLLDGYIPQPHGTVGRSPWWWKDKIEAWISEGRPRHQ